MSALDRLIDAAAKRCDPQNDSEVARRLGLTRAAVSAWRHGKPIGAEQLAALVDLAMVDAGAAIEILKEQAKTDAQRVVWGSLWTRLMPIMSTVRLSARKMAARLGAH
jgi:transcriptional regulator with XRE-family HTH domain